jgi:hypothetical protein
MCAAAVLPITDCWIGIRFGPSFLGDETDFSHCFLKSTIACSRAHEAAISNDRQLREYVSVTDMKIEIEISDVLQFRSVVHMSKDSAQHSDVFLTISYLRK